VRVVGLEPTHREVRVFETLASTIPPHPHTALLPLALIYRPIPAASSRKRNCGISFQVFPLCPRDRDR